MKKVTISLEEQLIEAMKQLSIKDRRVLNTTYSIALEEYLKNRGINVDIATQISKPINASAAQMVAPKPAKIANKPTEQKSSTNPAAVPKWKQNLVAKQEAKKEAKPIEPPIIDDTELTLTNTPTPVLNEHDEF